MGILDEIGFVEMDENKKTTLLFCTDLHIMINIDIFSNISEVEDPRYNIILDPLNFNKFYGKLFPEARKVRINRDFRKAQIYGFNEKSRIWQKVYRLETSPISSICDIDELRYSDMKYKSKDISDIEIYLSTQYENTSV